MMKKMLLIMLGTTIGILMLEGVLQVYYYLYKNEKNLVINKTEAQRKKFFLPDNYYNYKINSYGLRGDDFSWKNKYKKKRILCIGDSCMFGWGIYSEDKTIPAIISKYNYNRIEAFNGGIPGYTMKAALDFYEEKLYNLNPDIVIMYVGWNDLNSIFSRIDLENSIIKFMMNDTKIKIWRILKGRYVKPFYRKYIYDIRDINYNDLAGIKHQLERINKLRKRFNVKIYVCTVPSFRNIIMTDGERKEYYDLISQWLAQEQLSTSKKLWHMADAIGKLNNLIRINIGNKYTIDLDKILDKKVTKKFFTDGYHPSELGAEKISGLIISKLAENNDI